MSIAKDPSFRAQYESEPKPDEEFAAALGGMVSERIARGVNPAIQIISPPDGQVWLPSLGPLK